jgi:hypothetical protein
MTGAGLGRMTGGELDDWVGKPEAPAGLMLAGVAGPGLVREGQYQGYLTDTVIFLRSHFLTDQVGISDLPPAK